MKARAKISIPSSSSSIRGKKAMGAKKDTNKSLLHKASVIDSSLIYAERELWSPQCSLWRRYYVKKPRLPGSEDEQTKWIEHPRNSPTTFGGFIGSHNKAFFDSLELWCSQFEQAKNLPDVMTIAGPPGSGKSSAARIFVDRLLDVLNFSPTNQAPKWRLLIDAKQYVHELNNLWVKISKFIENPFERIITTSYRLVVIDNFSSIPPSQQQALKALTTANNGKVKYLFICENPKDCMVGFFLSKASIVKTKVIQERDALSVILSICHRNKIGYELEGIKLAFDQHPNFHLSAIIEILQEVFLKAYFVSRENVVKVCRLDIPPPEVPPSAALQPFDRCNICTLVPPCRHITQEQLDQQGMQRRKELPRYKAGSMTCPEFQQYARCTIFNKHHQCSLDHPKNLHTIMPEPKRCPQCTIPWPCEHCAYSSQRRRLWSLIREIHDRIGRLRQINIPDPPLYYTRHLDSFPHWRERVREIEAGRVTGKTTGVLKGVEEWFHTAYSINGLAYSNRCKTLLETFGELCTSELLDTKLGEGGYVPPPPGEGGGGGGGVGGRKPPLHLSVDTSHSPASKSLNTPSNKSLSSQAPPTPHSVGSASNPSLLSSPTHRRNSAATLSLAPTAPPSPSSRSMGSGVGFGVR